MTVRRCLLCGHTAIAAKEDGRFVTTACVGCKAVLLIEFDPPDEPTLRARIERIDEHDSGGTKLARSVTIDERPATATLEIVPSL